MRYFRWSAGSFRSMFYNDSPIQDIPRLVFFSMCKALGSLLKADFHLETPSDCSTRSISLCVSAPTSIRGASVSRDIPSRSLHFFSHYFFGIEMDNPLFVEHFPWQASACPYVSSPTCHCLWLVRLVH